MDLHVTPATRPLRGSLRVPSDKSISHRAVLFAAMAEGVSHLEAVLDSADVRSTIAAVQQLGAEVVVDQRDDGLSVTVRGWGAEGPQQPDAPIDCGNSGTTARLLMGVLAGWPIAAQLAGDASLSRRPMLRVAEPLRTMGASVVTAESGTLPLTVRGGQLRGIEYRSPVASAQVKTAVLLAGLRAEGQTSVLEPAASRDHTERLLPAFGVPVVVEGRRALVLGSVTPVATDVRVPADPSSAAFMAVAAAIVPGSSIELSGVSVNPTRSGYLRVLERMGAEIALTDQSQEGAEPIATVRVRQRTLRATHIAADEVPSLVDELPILALAACFAEGMSRFEGVGELRVKESDRLEAIVAGLGALGARVRAGHDWLEIHGGSPLHGAALASLGDHRLAMTWTVAGLVAAGSTLVAGFDAVGVSYPGFQSDLEALLGGSLSAPAC
jgi:3-phosphoshikimate 1-carboxyvinyltransferase